MIGGLVISGRIRETFIGDKLREIMAKQNITNVELARMTGLSVTTISRLRNNQNGINGGTLMKISRVLGVPLDVFEEGNTGLAMNTLALKGLEGLPRETADAVINAIGNKRKLEYVIAGIRLSEESNLNPDEIITVVLNYENLVNSIGGKGRGSIK